MIFDKTISYLAPCMILYKNGIDPIPVAQKIAASLKEKYPEIEWDLRTRQIHLIIATGEHFSPAYYRSRCSAFKNDLHKMWNAAIAPYLSETHNQKKQASKERKFPSNVRVLRKKKGKKQTEVAEAAGVYSRLIQKIELGENDISNITFANAVCIAYALQVDLEDLILPLLGNKKKSMLKETRYLTDLPIMEYPNLKYAKES